MRLSIFWRRRGRRQACEALWPRQQIGATARYRQHTAFRSDQLIGSDVVNPRGEDLGSVDDIVLGPQADKIAYLVIGRGGLFGIDEK